MSKAISSSTIATPAISFVPVEEKQIEQKAVVISTTKPSNSVSVETLTVPTKKTDSSKTSVIKRAIVPSAVKTTVLRKKEFKDMFPFFSAMSKDLIEEDVPAHILLHTEDAQSTLLDFENECEELRLAFLKKHKHNTKKQEKMWDSAIDPIVEKYIDQIEFSITDPVLHDLFSKSAIKFSQHLALNPDFTPQTNPNSPIGVPVYMADIIDNMVNILAPLYQLVSYNDRLNPTAEEKQELAKLISTNLNTLKNDTSWNKALEEMRTLSIANNNDPTFIDFYNKVKELENKAEKIVQKSNVSV